MKRIDRGAVQTAVEEAGLDFELAIREFYRGKGETEEGFGLVFEDTNTIQAFFVEMALFDADIARQLVAAAKHDQMGRRLITYFPGWELALI